MREVQGRKTRGYEPLRRSYGLCHAEEEVAPCEPIAPGARGWDPASPAHFIEWFLCRCLEALAPRLYWRIALPQRCKDLCGFMQLPHGFMHLRGPRLVHYGEGEAW